MERDHLRIRERVINLVGAFYLLRKGKPPTHKSGITVLNYHRISGRSLRRHLDYIQAHYQVLSPQTFFAWLEDKAVIEKTSVVFTFDDGYRSFYKEIYPILQETKTPVFMFVPTAFIGKRSYFWADELQVALKESDTHVVVIGDKKFKLYSRLYRSEFCAEILQYLSSLDEKSRIEICKQILTKLGVSLTEDDMRGYRFLNWSEMLEMSKSGLVVFGSHTVNHPNLTLLSDDTLNFELQESKRILESRLGQPVLAFAYPYGGRKFFDWRIAKELEKTGYFCAFTTIQGGIENKRQNRFRLKRVMLFDYQNEGTVALKLDRCGT